MLVSKVEEIIYIGDQGIPLGTNQYPGTVFPDGYKHISSFERDPLPTTTFTLGEAQLTKTIFMVHGSNTTVIEYKNTSQFTYKLWLNPLYVYRDFHGTEQERHDHKYTVNFMGHMQGITPCDGSEVIYFKHTHGVFTESRTWNKNMQFKVDQERGHEFNEDVYSIGYVEYDLPAGKSTFLMFTLDNTILAEAPEKLKEDELSRLSIIVPQKYTDKFLTDLIRCGDQFIVRRKSINNYSVIAGYHWFTDWGRDSMIAIRGLCIASGKQEEARSVISTFLSYLNQGLIPNRFPDYEGEELEYNTVDATLWLFVALYEYDIQFNDTEFLKTVFPKLQEILNHHIKGTKHGIHVMENGLLSAGSKHIQITWMDAKLNDIVFTPREGCAVEINALWFNALKIYEHVAERLKERKKKVYTQTRMKLAKQFKASFWNEKGYLNDVVSENGFDPAIRPNQIFAVSLPFSILSKKEEKQVVETVKEHLLTPYGLRTLDKNNPAFKPNYAGDVYLRDSAYHQGTVWPFLMPEYHLAYLKVSGNSEKAKKEVQKELAKIKEHFYNEQGIYGISEVFDGLDPKEGKGCMQQAWSVANLIWLMVKNNLII